MAEIQVSKLAKEAKESTPKGDVLKVKVLDTVTLRDPDVKHGLEVFEAGATVEVPEAIGKRFVRVGAAEKI